MHEGLLEQVFDRSDIARRTEPATDEGRQRPFVPANQQDECLLLATPNPLDEEHVAWVFHRIGHCVH